MNSQQVTMVLAALWVISAITVLVGSAHATSMADRVALTIFGIFPPVAVWFWWNQPSQTLSESIHQVRDEGRATRPPTRID